MNIGLLIEKAESAYYDAQLGFAAKIIKPVGSKWVDGKEYQLQIVMTSVKEEIIEIPEPGQFQKSTLQPLKKS